MKKNIFYASALAACVLMTFVAGCTPQTSAHGDEPYQEFLQEKYQKLSDGRTVMCLYREGRIGGYSSGNTPALSCDWANAIVHPPK